jgi:hypothetical protein
MECFLASKTTTLHDLANNGLLQLDQIRSYNTLSNHTLDDNNNTDQIKENEEDLLDEIDISSRRSSNKSTDQNIISKRLTDTSISTKQLLSLKSPRSSKTSDDHHYRKSSLPTDANYELKNNKISLTKQQRRQTLVDSTTSSSSSRLSHQTLIKKNFKCMNISQSNKKKALFSLFLFRHFSFLFIFRKTIIDTV